MSTRPASGMWMHDLTSGICGDSGVTDGQDPVHTGATHLSYVDFHPSMIEDCKLSGETQNQDLPFCGPKFEELDSLILRANSWLAEHPKIRLVSCETVEFEAAVPSSQLHPVNSTRSVNKPAVEWLVCLIVLRLWVCVQPNIVNTALQRIGCISMVPERLEIDPSQLIPKFENFSATTEKFKRYIRDEHIPGMVLSMETCELRLSHDNCEVNPNSTFWMGSKDKDIYCLSYFRLFYTQGYSHREEIGFKDFIPSCSSCDDNQTKGESYSRLISIANAWLRQQPHLRVTNTQTLIYRLYSGLDMESNKEKISTADTSRSLFVQFPNKPSNNLVILRVYFAQTTRYNRIHNLHSKSLHCKTFLPSIKGKDGQTSWATTKSDMLKSMKKAAKWIQSTGANILGAETIKFYIPRSQKKVDVDGSHISVDGAGEERTLFALRIYYEGCYQNTLSRAISTERLKFHVTSHSEQCAIL